MEKEIEKMTEKVEENLEKLQNSYIYDQKYFWRTKYTQYLEEEPIRKDYVLYEAYGGCGMVCNPYAIFKYLLNHAQYRSLTHIWVISDWDSNRPMMERFQRNPRVRFVKYDSLEYRKYLATAKYLVTNNRFPNYFIKRKNQIYLNTWNDIPRYAIGFDKPEGNIRAGNLIRNLLAADYLLAATPEMASFFQRNVKLHDIFEGKILVEGQPRSLMWMQEKHYSKRKIMHQLQRCGVNLDHARQTVVYIPAWRSRWNTEPEQLVHQVSLLRQSLKQSMSKNIQLLVKIPANIAEDAWNYLKNEKGMISSAVDTTDLLGMTDLLIFDYSGIYYDALLMQIPMLCYTPDKQEYEKESKKYEFAQEIFVPQADDIKQLNAILENFSQSQKQMEKKRMAQRKEYLEKLENGSLEHIVQAVFGKKLEGVHMVSAKDTSKKKLLFYGGNLQNNGITQSFLQLLEEIDNKKYDITVITSHSKNQDIAKQIRAMNKKVRVLHRVGVYDSLLTEDALHTTIIGQNSTVGIKPPAKLYQREIRRCFGNSRFDYAIDYTGESIFFRLLFRYMKDTAVITWTHSVLEQEKKRGKKEIFWKPAELPQSGYYIEKQSGIRVRQMELIPLPNREKQNFALLHMIWTEEEQAQLIEAFQKYHQTERESNLYRIGTTAQVVLGQSKGYIYQTADCLTDIGPVTYPIDYAATCTTLLLPEKRIHDKQFLEDLAQFDVNVLVVDPKEMKESDFYGKQTLNIKDIVCAKENSQSIYQRLEQKLSEVKQRA